MASLAMQKVVLPRAASRSLRVTSTRAVRAVRVNAVAEATETTEKRVSPLEKGGTLKGSAALGKDASAAVAKSTSKANGTFLSMRDGRFVDDRWINGTWDFEQFKNAEGEVDYDKVTPTPPIPAAIVS